MSEGTTTGGGFEQNQERDGEAGGSPEFGGAPPESTLAATNAPIREVRLELALRDLLGTIATRRHLEHDGMSVIDCELCQSVRRAEAALHG